MTDLCEFIAWCGATRKVTIESTLGDEENTIVVTFVAVNGEYENWSKRKHTLPAYLSNTLDIIKEECEEAGF